MSRARPGDLMCPSCGRAHGADERFCVTCGLPLVQATGPSESVPETEAQLRARKVLPQYTEGPLVRVATARHQSEAELISGLLLEAGVPSLARRSGGFDVPDMLAAGPRDILVPASGEEIAREALGTVRPADAGAPAARGGAGGTPIRTGTRSRPTRAMAFGLAAVLALAGIAPLVSWLARVT